MKTTDIYGQVPKNVHNAVINALNEVNSYKEAKVRRKIKFSTCLALMAVVGVITTITVAAAGFYFEHSHNVDKGKLTYEFKIDYDLKPGEFEVTPGYIPPGFYFNECSSKYYSEDNYGDGITLFPVYNTLSLDKENEIIPSHIEAENIEKTVLSGMEAHIITYAEAEKYERRIDILLFNPTDGYVLKISGAYTVPYDELIKFADSLTVSKSGESDFETLEEKEERKSEEKFQLEKDMANYEAYAKLMKEGFPDGALIPQGNELILNEVGYTVNECEFFEDGSNLEESGFLTGWRESILSYINPDGTLRPYTRQHYDNTGKLIDEKKAEQIFLRVNITARCYEQPIDTIPLNANIQYTKRAENENLTWDNTIYRGIPSENCMWTYGEQCVWISVPNQKNDATSGKQHFYTKINEGESITYDIVFIVDKDRADNILLSINGANNMENDGIDGIDGYLKLEK